MARVAPLVEVMNAAAKTEPEIAALLGSLLKKRLYRVQNFVGALRSGGPLRPQLHATEAAETMWAVSSAEVYNLLMVTRGWSIEQYQTWLADTLTTLLLP